MNNNIYNKNLTYYQENFITDGLRKIGAPIINRFKSTKQKAINELNEIQKTVLILIYLCINKLDKNTLEKINEKIKNKISEQKFNKLIELSTQYVNENIDIKNSIDNINIKKNINETIYNKINYYNILLNEDLKKFFNDLNNDKNFHNIYQDFYNSLDNIGKNNSNITVDNYIRQLKAILSSISTSADQNNLNNNVAKNTTDIESFFDDIFSKCKRSEEFRNANIQDTKYLVDQTKKLLSYVMDPNKISSNDSNEVTGLCTDIHRTIDISTKDVDYSPPLDDIIQYRECIRIASIILPFILEIKPIKKFIFEKLLCFIKHKETKEFILQLILISLSIPGLIITIGSSSLFFSSILGFAFLFRLGKTYKVYKHNRNISDKIENNSRDISYIQSLPFFNYNINNKNIIFYSKSANIFSRTETFYNFIKYLKDSSSNNTFENTLLNSQNRILFYLLNFNENIKIIGFFDKNSQSTLNFLINNEIIDKFKEFSKNNFNLKDFVSAIILTLKSNFELLGEYLLLNNTDNNCVITFINTINNPENNEFIKYTASIFNKSPYELGYLVYYNILNENITNKEDSSNYPINISSLSNININDQFILDGDKIINIEQIKQEKQEEQNKEEKQNNDNIKLPPLKIIDPDSNISVSGGIAGGVIGTIAGKVLDNTLFQQWTEEFCNLHPIAGPILKPILQNPKTSGAIIGTLLGMGMKPLAKKLINFFKSKSVKNE